jgi:rubrerythrin
MTHKLTAIDTDDGLKISIQISKDMGRYYEKASTLVSDDDAKAILTRLGEKHQIHQSELIKAYANVSGKKILYLNLGRKHKLNTLVKCPDDPNDSVRMAKKNESEARAFYLTLSRRIYESDIRSFFRDLAQRAEQNLALLESSFVEPLALDKADQEDDSNLYDDVSSSTADNAKSW